MKRSSAERMLRLLGTSEDLIPFALFLVDFLSLCETGRPAIGCWLKNTGSPELNKLSVYDVRLIKKVVSILSGEENLFNDELREERFRTCLGSGLAIYKGSLSSDTPQA